MVFVRRHNLFERLCGNTFFVVAVAVLVLCLFMISSYYTYHNSLNETVQGLKTDIEHQTKTIAASIAEYFHGKQEFVQMMANYLLVQEYLDRVRQDTIESDPHFANLCSLLLTVSGSDKEFSIAWLASLRDEYSLSFNDISYEKDGWSTRTRPWFPGTMDAENIYFSDPYWDFETNSVCVSLIKKVYAPSTGIPDDATSPGDVVGVAGLDLFFPPIQVIMDDFVKDNVHYPILVSRDGSILYHPKSEHVFEHKLGDFEPALEPFTKEMTQLKTGAHLISLHRENSQVYFGYAPVEGTTWSVGMIWQKQDAEKTRVVFEHSLIRSLLLNLFLFSIPILFFGIVLARRSRRFQDMKRLYDTIVDHMQTGIAVIDPETDLFLLTNPAYETFLGISRKNPAPFSTYSPILNIAKVEEILQSKYMNNSYLIEGNVPWSNEITLLVDDVKRYCTHFFISFYDFGGRRLLLSVLSDVTEQKRMQDTLREARDVAESANLAKSSFLANMSHEIRTPMNGILGLIDLLADSPLDSQQHQYIDLIRGSANALLLVINDILDHSKIEAGKLLIETYKFDLRQLIRELSFAFAHSAEQKSLEFQTLLLPDVPQFVRGDANRLRQILSNLLSNAVKFSTTGGTVKMHVASVDDPRKSDWIRFEVSDTGIGISDAQMMQLFKPFEQADKSTSRKFGGTGLGLAISKRLIQLMGGDIGCYSNYGSGSTFWCELSLPMSSDHHSGVFDPSGNSATASASRPLKILLVDDVRVNLIVLSTVLQQWGHVTEAAEDGSQALELLKKNQYDLVFMDCQMPKMDGYECTQRVRNPQTGVKDPKVPIIAVTAHAMVGDKERCLSSGMDDYISKPINHGELKSKLSKWAPR